MRRTLLAFTMVFIVFAGCSKQQGPGDFHRSLIKNIGYMTYDRAPSSFKDEKKRFTAAWRHEKPGVMTAEIENLVYTVPVGHGWELILTFNKKTNRLYGWEYREW